MWDSNLHKSPTIVVVPAGLVAQWATEFRKVANEIPLKVLSNSRENCRGVQRKEEIAATIDTPGVLLTTYTMVQMHYDIIKQRQWGVMALDEGHIIKNPTNIYARSLEALDASFKIICTGTPVQNNILELFALVTFLYIKHDVKKVINALGTNINTTTNNLITVVFNRLHAFLSPFTLRRQLNHLQNPMPEFLDTYLMVPLAPFEAQLYTVIVQHFKSKCGKGRQKGQESVAATTDKEMNCMRQHLRKVVNHPFLWLKSYPTDEHMIRMSGKLEALDKLLPKLKAKEHHVLIFTTSTMVSTTL